MEQKNPYFLYVEDDEDDVVLLKEMMQMTGSANHFLSVKNGFEAIRFLQNIKEGETYPFLILMDIKMPKLNGEETLKYLRSDDMYCLIPVLMFSVTTAPETLLAFKNLGTEVLSKPVAFSSWETVFQKINCYTADV